MRYFSWFILILALAGCQTASGPRVNGVYSGGLYDNSVGFLGGFAIDVTTRGSSVSGDACFVAITGETACNTLSGNMNGDRFTFTVGAISFSSTVRGNSIEGTYSSRAGSGTIELTKDSSNLAASSLGNEVQRQRAGELLEVLRQ